MYLIGYLDERCRGKIFPFTEGAGAPAVQPRPAEAAAQIKCATKKGYQTARVGDSIDLSYATSNTRRGRVGHGIAHTLTACGKQGTLCFVDLNADPKLTENARRRANVCACRAGQMTASIKYSLFRPKGKPTGRPATA